MEPVFELLNREWARIGPDPSLAARFPEVLGPAGASTLDTAVVREPRLPREARDRLHRSVVTRAIAGDRLAGRVELQLLLPAAGRLAAQFWGLGDSDDRASAAVAAMYGAILTYPLARRSRYVAANIVVAAARQLRREVNHPDRHALELFDEIAEADEPAVVDVRHAAHELAELLLDAVHGGRLSTVDARLIAASRIEDRHLADIAETAGCSLRSIQRRRRSAERALATMAVAA